MDATIKASFWTDNRIEEQPAEIKLACLWLVTNPARDLCGFTRASNKRFTFETSLPASSLEGACKALPSSFARVAPGIYFARNFLRHQFGKGGRLSPKNNVVIAAVRYARSLPEPLATAFFETYPELAEKRIERLPSASPSQPPSEKSEGVRAEKEKEQEHEDSSKRIPDIIAIYPKREKDHDATLELARQIERDGIDLATVEAGTRAIAAIIPRLSGGHLNRYVPSALAFFRDRRWQDDPQTWLRNAPATRTGAPPPAELDLGGRKGTIVKITPSMP